ncbi:MAG: isoprenylcysteine carboxylmethyltransferase family protein [Deltaproteobacteria bacterium]|nr:isoprenylcysteine carboxylmethyltransferase family protein [Deltaproteobacteria bacterium]
MRDNRDNIVHKSALRSSEAVDFLVLMLGMMLYSLHPLPFDNMVPRLVQLVTGPVLAALGIYLILTAKSELKKYDQYAQPGWDTTRLVTTGIYSRSRNPIYLASLLFHCTIGFLANNLWFFILLPLSMAMINYWLIGPEEAFFRRKYEREYEEYCRRVKRWL